jgi:hypothetical protein
MPLYEGKQFVLKNLMDVVIIFIIVFQNCYKNLGGATDLKGSWLNFNPIRGGWVTWVSQISRILGLTLTLFGAVGSLGCHRSQGFLA